MTNLGILPYNSKPLHLFMPTGSEGRSVPWGTAASAARGKKACLHEKIATDECRTLPRRHQPPRRNVSEMRSIEAVETPAGSEAEAAASPGGPPRQRRGGRRLASTKKSPPTNVERYQGGISRRGGTSARCEASKQWSRRPKAKRRPKRPLGDRRVSGEGEIGMESLTQREKPAISWL